MTAPGRTSRLAGAMHGTARYRRFVVDSRLQYFKPDGSHVARTFADEVSAGLMLEPKRIAPKFFYDQRGSDLFEQICLLPEYYPTRAEISILEMIKGKLAGHLKGECRLVELGSGSSVKTKLVIDALGMVQDSTEYFPIDISDILAESSERLLADYGDLRITGIIDTYEGGLEFLKGFGRTKSLVIFLGSSYGNFAPDDGRDFLNKVAAAMNPGDMLLIGLDLVKDTKTLELAYNDSLGVTARFNLNVLARINDELDADFDLERFEHRAVYNQGQQRIEMHLRSLASQSVVLSKPGQAISLQKDELIHTEYSYKFHADQIRGILRDAGFETVELWQDGMSRFSLTLASRV